MLKVFKNNLFRILLGFWLAYNFLLLAQRIYLKSLGLSFIKRTWGEVIFVDFAIEFTHNGLFVLIIALISRALIKLNLKFYYSIIAHFFLSLITVLIFTSIYYIYQNLAGNPFFKLEFNRILTGSVRYLNIHFLVYFSTVFIVYTYYYIKKSNESELQKLKLKEQLSAVQVNVLKYQLHPHFFFNTLNSISSLIEIKPKLAQDTLADFSDLLRDIVYLKDSNQMPLSVEMDILKRYIDIMSIRFSEDFKAKINIEKGLDNVLIPSLILQPIVENSIKYGYSEKFTELELEINIRKENSTLVIEISNNGEPLSKKIIYGNGLTNTIDRLNTLYENDYVFEMKNTNSELVKTTIIIPFKSTT